MERCKRLKLDPLGPLVTRPGADQAQDRWQELAEYLVNVESFSNATFRWETFRSLSREFYNGAYKHWSEEGHRPSVDVINKAAFQLAKFFTEAASRVGGDGAGPPKVTHFQLGDPMNNDECSSLGGCPLGQDYDIKGRGAGVAPLRLSGPGLDEV